MSRVRGLAAVVGLLAVLASCWAGQVPQGNYKLSYLTSTAEITSCIVKLEEKDSKLTGTLVAGDPRGRVPMTLVKAAQEGNTIRITIKGAAGEQTFEGQIPTEKSAVIRGAFGNDRLLSPAQLSPTEESTLTGNQITKQLNIEPMRKYQQLSTKALTLNLQANRERDAEKKAELLKQYREAAAEAQKQAPQLYREVLAKYADTPAVIDAALNLLNASARNGVTPELAKDYAAKVEKFAAPYGTLLQTAWQTRLAESLVNQPGLADLALEYAQKAEKGLSAKPDLETQNRVLRVLANAQRKMGHADKAAETEQRLAKLEAEIDREYLAKLPPFKPTAYEGRKAKSDRVVVMELFTGAQCPPCVAADVAFDALEKSYKPTDVVLIQYHMHIPGPDPLTNADTEARFAYYQAKFAQNVRGTPTTVFNGKPLAGGGGAMDKANVKYDQYREILNDMLEKPGTLKLNASVVRTGDKMDIKVNTGGITEPEDLKLCVVLLEEKVRYVGGNRLRYHHHVVRDFPGGVQGLALTEKEGTHTVKADLSALRAKLTSYLDEQAKTRVFPNPNRPMDFKHLKVIAFVQNDKTLEILQAVQVDVPEESTKTAQK